MITLITGVPGSGKTSAAVDLLTREFKDRPLFVDGLNGLKLEHVPIDVLAWPTEAPDGAVIVVDEVQRKWRPRGPGAKVPDSVVGLETHRHRGIDFIIITQNPRLVDLNVRMLVGRHVHIRDTGWMGRWWYEWPECSESCSWRSCENKRRYTLPKHVFDQYTSASMHVKPVRKAPLVLFLAIAALLACFALLGWTYKSFSKTEDKTPALPATVKTIEAGATSGKNEGVRQPVGYDYSQFIPRVSHLPESASAFDAIRQVVNMPLVTGAMCINEKCKCYTQQGTNAGLTHDECAKWVENKPFDPYSPPAAQASTADVRTRPSTENGDRSVSEKVQG